MSSKQMKLPHNKKQELFGSMNGMRSEMMRHLVGINKAGLDANWEVRFSMNIQSQKVLSRR